MKRLDDLRAWGLLLALAFLAIVGFLLGAVLISLLAALIGVASAAP